MLAAMKLGAVMVPATTLLTRDDLLDRFARGRVRHVDREQPKTPANSPTCPAITRGSRSARRAGLAALRGALRGGGRLRAGRRDARERPAVAVLHLGHDGEAEARAAQPSSYPVGHLSTMYWIGLKPGDIHLNISSPGWAKHAWSCFFAPWNAERLRVHARTSRGSTRKALLDAIVALRRHDVLRAADGLAHADPGGPDARGRCRCARWSAPASRSIRRSSSRCKAAWGLTIRDGYGQTETTAQIGNSAGPARQAGLDGPAAAGLSRRAARCRRAASRTRARSA